MTTEQDNSIIESMIDCTFTNKKTGEEIENGFQIKYKDGSIEYGQEGVLRFLEEEEIANLKFK